MIFIFFLLFNDYEKERIIYPINIIKPIVVEFKLDSEDDICDYEEYILEVDVSEESI